MNGSCHVKSPISYSDQFFHFCVKQFCKVNLVSGQFLSDAWGNMVCQCNWPTGVIINQISSQQFQCFIPGIFPFATI
jgi:hypothetical protein